MRPKFEINILGKSSAIPTKDTFPSSQVVNFNHQYFLVDCGEGCQMQLRRNQISFTKIKHIFISHLHGDHFYGLFGLISTMNLMNRKLALHIYSHPKLESILKVVFFNNGDGPGFPLIFHPLNYQKKELIVETKLLKIYSFPLRHKIPTAGFSFEEKQGPHNIRKNVIEKYNITPVEIRRIKAGYPLVREDKMIAENEELCYSNKPLRSYAYCSDTAYYPRLKEFLKQPTLMYHEATYLSDMEGKEETHYHSTGKQAAKIAKMCGAKQLMIGHFSTRYTEYEDFLNETKPIFKNTILANENESVVIP